MVTAEFELYSDAGQRGYYWRVVHVLDSTRLAVVTYTCDADDSNVEREIVSEVLRTFELEERAAEMPNGGQPLTARKRDQ